MRIPRLTSAIIKGFVEEFLMESYDDPVPVAKFHEELWYLFCSEHKMVGVAAPRGHGKTTSGTAAYALCSICFHIHRYILLISKTNSQAAEILQNIKTVLASSTSLRETFEVELFLRDREDDLVIRWKDKSVSRILIKGSDQDVRGALWENRRPDCILFDDAEGDEQVDSPERRAKFKKYVMNTIMPLGSKRCVIRWCGTIMHFDSFLANIMKNKSWKSRLFGAHRSFDDFSDILWKEKFSEEDLRKKQQEYIDAGSPEGYAQEYLNIAMVEGDGYFRTQDFLPMTEEDHQKFKKYYVGVDFAISLKQHADYTVMIVGGMDEENYLHIVDIRKGRWDGKQINEEMMSIRKRWQPELYFVEAGVIKLALGPFLYDDMRRSGKYLRLQEFTRAADKGTTNKTIQGMMRAGSVKFDEDMDGYAGLKHEMVQFGRQRIHDDQVDAMGMFGLGLEYMIEPEKDEVREEDVEEEFFDPRQFGFGGVNAVTGY